MSAIERTTRARECFRDGCDRRYDPFGRETGTPPRFCSIECWRLAKPVKAPKPRAQLARTTSTKTRKAISPASPAQRTAIKDRACVVCAQAAGYCDPAHLISRAALTEGQDDPRAVVPLCRRCHDEYDHGGLSLLEYLEPHWRSELAAAVERYGLLRTLQRVTNQHWQPVVVAREGRADAA